MVIQKKDVTASRFVRGLSIPRVAQTAVLHTRWWTQGSPTNNNNNHPIQVANIVGVHNGGIYNDDELFTEMGIAERRIAQVDSEAIFATLAYGLETYRGTEFSTRVPQATHLTDLLEVIEGSAAIAWLNTEEADDVLHVSRIDSSPVAWGQTALGSFVFASTAEALYEATDAVHMEIVHAEFMEEGSYMRVKAGRIHDVFTFKPGMSDFATSWNRRYYSGSSWGSNRSTITTLGTRPQVDEIDEYEYWWAENLKHLDGGNSVDNVIELPAGDDTHKREWVSTANGGYRRETNEEVLERAVAAAAAEQQAIEWDEHDRLFTKDDLMPEFTQAFVPGRYLNLASPKPLMDEESYKLHYATRKQAAEKWFSELNEPTALAKSKLRMDLHYWLRPGDWVYTKFCGEERFGQVVTVPDTFPGGCYLLRVPVMNDDRTAEWEVAYITRLAHEFESASNSLVVRRDDVTKEVKLSV